MAFACIHVPNFILQAAIRVDAALRDHPVAVLDGAPPLERVVAANRLATARGLRLRLTRAQAEECEGVALLKRSLSAESAAHAALLDLGWSFSPRLEDSAVDTVALDLSGLLGLFGSEKNIACRLVEGAAALNFAVHVAISGNLDAGFHAAHGFPGITILPPGEEGRCLGGLPLRALAAAPEILETLESWGVRSCGALAALPAPQLSERLGQEGVRLHALASGASRRSLIVAEPETRFEETMELDHAVAELEPLTFVLARLLEQLCTRLTARALAAAAIGIHFDLEPARLGEAAAVHEKTLALPVPMRDPGMLLSLLRLHLQSQPPARAIVKVVLSAVAAPRRGAQNGLFLPERPQPEKLELTIARLAHLVGDGQVGAPELVDTHCPGKFRMGPFSVVPEEKTKKPRRAGKMNAEKASDQEAAEEDGQASRMAPGIAPRTAFRFFRPPLPARVELRGGRPARISFHGHDAGVAAASGPWRTSGDWWDANAWHCDEWDVEICFPAPSLAARSNETRAVPLPESTPPRSCGGLYRIFFDAIRRSWFVRGAYD